MDWQEILVAVVFSLLSLAWVLSSPIGLPGTWLLIGLAVAIDLVDAFALGGEDALTFGWLLLGMCGGLGLLGEGVEAVAGAAGTRMGGGSRRGMLGAILGGLLGALLLTFLIPIPLIGTLIGALVGTFVGAFIGEATGERAAGTRHSLKAAFAATIGRLAGTLGKTAIAAVIWVVLVRAAFLP